VQVEKQPFGAIDEGQVDRYTLSNDNGMTVQILTLGGIIQTLTVPDQNGQPGNVTLGFATLDEYVRFNSQVSFGCIVGRFANRIGLGTFELDGERYHLPINMGPNALHGGLRGFGAHLWSGEAIEESGSVGVRLQFTSPDSDEGFPGKLDVTVTYTLDNKNALAVRYRAVTDKATVINLTNHAYFNLSGEGSGSILDHEMRLFSSVYAPTDIEGLPEGPLADVSGTPFDFRSPRPIGSRIRENHQQIVFGHGYDHNFVVDRAAGDVNSLAPTAIVRDPVSGRTLSVSTTEPGVQFYTGNFLKAELVGPSGRVYRQADGFCLETQHYPDSPNRHDFPSTVLRPGEQFDSTTVFAFGVDA
jgi:aldose 1-epimerase